MNLTATPIPASAKKQLWATMIVATKFVPSRSTKTAIIPVNITATPTVVTKTANTAKAAIHNALFGRLYPEPVMTGAARIRTLLIPDHYYIEKMNRLTIMHFGQPLLGPACLALVWQHSFRHSV